MGSVHLQGSTLSQPGSFSVGGSAHSGSVLQFLGHGSSGAEPYHSMDESDVHGSFLSASAGTGAHNAGNVPLGRAQTQVCLTSLLVTWAMCQDAELLGIARHGCFLSLTLALTSDRIFLGSAEEYFRARTLVTH